MRGEARRGGRSEEERSGGIHLNLNEYSRSQSKNQPATNGRKGEKEREVLESASLQHLFT